MDSDMIESDPQRTECNDCWTRVELRVHGIGDHTYLDPLGSPTLAASRGGYTPDTVKTPTLPQHHELRILNWSYSSRRLAGLLWYLALPFTFVNVAGHMAPAGTDFWSKPTRGLARFLTCVAGALVTVVAQLWAIAIIETIYRPVAVGAIPHLATSTVVGTTLLMLVGMLGRLLYLRRFAARDHHSYWLFFSCLVSAAAICAMGACLLCSPPTRWIPPPPNAPEWSKSFLKFLQPALMVDTPRPSSYEEIVRYPGKSFGEQSCNAAKDHSADLFEWRWDTMNIVTYGSILSVSLLAALVLVLALLRLRKTDGSRSALAGAALMLMCSITFLNAIASSARLGVEWLLIYLNDFNSLFPWVSPEKGQLAAERVVLPYQNPACQIGARLIDDFVLVTLFGVISLTAALVLVNLDEHGAGRPARLCDSVERLKYIHRLVCGLESRLWLALILGAIIWSLFLYAVFAVVRSGNDVLISGNAASGNYESYSEIMVIASHVAAFLTLVFLMLKRRIMFIRVFVAKIADIAGFWPVRYHPFAGRSYRPYVENAIRAELDRQGLQRVVLVGHSQGSVICAWVAANSKAKQATSRPKLALVTCGSPLRSLYEAFFPCEMNQQEYEKISESRIPWKNFWRQTDPIATEIGTLETTKNDCLVDPADPLRDSRPRGHKDYWIEPQQIDYIAEVMAGKHDKGQPPQTVSTSPDS